MGLSPKNRGKGVSVKKDHFLVRQLTKLIWKKVSNEAAKTCLVGKLVKFVLKKVSSQPSFDKFCSSCLGNQVDILD